MAFNLPDQTSFSQFRPVTTQTPFTRPSDWIAITDAPNIVQFLVSDVAFPAYAIQTTFTQTGGVGNIYIDWGDGTSTTVSSTTATNSEKTYTSGGTPCSLGYNTWKITISGDVGTRITAASFYNPTYWGAGVSYNCGLLEEYYGDGTILTASQLHYGGANVKPFFFSLVYSKLPSTITSSIGPDFAYYNCTTLQKVVMPTSMPNCDSFNNTFNQCYLLQEVTLPSNATFATTYNLCFGSCYNLTGVTLPTSVTASTIWTSTFSSCFSLKNITLPSFGAVTDFSSMFNSCYSLLTCEIINFGTYTGGTVNLASMFSSAYSLEYIKLPATVTTGQVFSMNAMFNSCQNLKTCILPTNMNANTITQCFNNCASLTYVSLPTSMPSLIVMSSLFSACRELTQVTLPTTVGATMDMGSVFNSCSALSSVVIPSSYNITNMANAFLNCNVLNSVTFPNNAQNGITGMNNIFFNCYALKSITLPTSLNSVSTLASAFQNCYSLTGVTFPTNMNAVTTMANAFSGCINLTSVTLPTSMTALGAANSAFNNCFRLLSVTMPTAVSTTIGYLSAFNNCYSLKNVVLPTTQTTSTSSVNAMFGNDLALTAITNTNYIGSTATNGTIVDGTNFGFGVYELQNIQTFTCRLSRIVINGIPARLSKLPGLRLSNTGSGQWAGSSPQIDISYTSLSTAAINLLFADMAAQPNVTSKTINITGASGAAGLTAADRLVVTSKGWTITG